MSYSQLIDTAMKLKNTTNDYVVAELRQRKLKADKTLISKLRNGKYVSLKDEFNVALAEILGIDKGLLRVAAMKARYPADLIELIKKIG